MDKELILEAVSAVMAFNIATDFWEYEAYIYIERDIVTLRLSDRVDSNNDVFIRPATSEDIKNFINKLKELECGE